MARTKWVKIEKSEERQETHAQNALLAFVPAVVIIVTALVILKYFHEWFAHVGWMFIVGGAVAVVYAVWQFAKSRTVKQIDVACPYCKEVNHLIETPKSALSPGWKLFAGGVRQVWKTDRDRPVEIAVSKLLGPSV